MKGNNIGMAINSGVNAASIQGLSVAAVGGILGGVDAARNGKHFMTGKDPYYKAKLENFELTYQNDPLNCKNATLESIEKMNGGIRTQDDFKKLGDAFIKENPLATPQEYFKHFGFDVSDPVNASYTKIGTAMRNGHPTVINESIEAGRTHTSTIIRIRQWTPNSNVKVWFGDPARGIWKGNWNLLANPNFNSGGYVFRLGK